MPSANGTLSMRQFTQLFHGDARGADSLHEARIGTRAEPRATMVLDRIGIVRYCNADAAQLFAAGAESLVGKHISALVPDLPFSRRTPGYNLAYAAFWAPDGPCRRHSGVGSSGGSFDLHIALERLEVEGRQYILLSLGHSATRESNY